MAHVGSFCALLSLLGRILLVSGGSSSPVCHFFTFRDAPASILTGSGTVWGRFWRLRHLIFRCFFVHVGLTCVNAPTLTKRWQEQQKSRFLIYRKPHAQAKKRRKIVPGAFGRDLSAKIALKTRLGLARLGFGGVWRSLGRHLAGFRELVGASWILLGPSGAPPGRFMGARGNLKTVSGLAWTLPRSICKGLKTLGLGFGHFLGCSSWSLGRFWASLGRSWPSRVGILAFMPSRKPCANNIGLQGWIIGMIV